MSSIIYLHQVNLNFRLHGSYNAINSGNIATALVDMTGGIGEIIRIVQKYKVPRDFFNSLMKNLQMNSLLTAGINVRTFLVIRKKCSGYVFFWVCFRVKGTFKQMTSFLVKHTCTCAKHLILSGTAN